MLSRRIVRAAPLRQAALPATRLPLIQQRTFLPESIVGKEVLDEKYPGSDYPRLSEAQDPGQVRALPVFPQEGIGAES